MKINSLAHVCLRSTDLAATRKFYCDELGMEKLFDFTRKGDVIGFYMKSGNGTFIEVFRVDAAEKIDAPKLHHFCLETDDLPALHARVRELGHTPGDIKLGADQTPQFWMKDPSGLDVEFQQYTPKSAQRTGATVEVNW